MTISAEPAAYTDATHYIPLYRGGMTLLAESRWMARRDTGNTCSAILYDNTGYGWYHNT